MNFLDQYKTEIILLVKPIIYILLGMLVYEIIIFIVKRSLEKSNRLKRHHQKRAKTITGLIINIIKYIIIIIVVIAILANFEINVTSIIAGLGITAAIVGLAFQDLAKDFIAGISIIVEDQYEIGDTVEVNGFLGEVVALGLRTTRIRNYKGQTLIVSNHTITQIINYNLANNLAVVEVSVSYKEDLNKVEKVLAELSKKMKEEYKNIKTNIQILGVEELDSSGIIYKIALETPPAEHFEIQRVLRKEIKLAFDKAKIEIPYQQIEVHNGK